MQYGRTEAILLSSRYAARHTLLMCCCIDSVLTEALNGMHLPPMSTLSQPTELRRGEVEATGRTSFNFFFKFQPVAIPPAYEPFSAGLDIREKRLKLIGRSPLLVYVRAYAWCSWIICSIELSFFLFLCFLFCCRRLMVNRVRKGGGRE